MKGDHTTKVKVSITTTDGEVLEFFTVEKPGFGMGTDVELARQVRDYIELRFEVSENTQPAPHGKVR